MKIYLVQREKGDYRCILLCANYKSVLAALDGLDGTDEVISVHFTNVEDITTKPKSNGYSAVRTCLR